MCVKITASPADYGDAIATRRPEDPQWIGSVVLHDPAIPVLARPGVLDLTKDFISPRSLDPGVNRPLDAGVEER